MMEKSRVRVSVMARYWLLFLVLVRLCKDVKALETSDVFAPMEAYWNSNLPNTSMPEIIRELIHPAKEDNFVWDEYLVTWESKNISMDVLRIFFRPKDIYPGAKIKNAISFGRSVTGSSFIPRAEAQAMPFSSEKLPQILYHYSIKPDSKEAKLIQRSLHDCKTPAPPGTKNFCARSLESLIDNVIFELGTRNIKVMSTMFLNNVEAKREKLFYKVASSMKELPEEKLVLCHPEPIPDTVYFCHSHTASLFKGYNIPLEGKNGTQVNAFAVCHYDTENFDPVIFQMLNWEPDTKPICHFLMEDHLIWAPNS